MKICIEGATYEGSPAEILAQMRDAAFSRDDYTSLREYLVYTARRIEDLTDIRIPIEQCDTDDGAAREIISALESIGALDVLEDDDA